MFLISDIIREALREDIGSGDITTDNLVDDNILGIGVILAKEDITIAGLNIIRRVFKELDSNVVFFSEWSDGDKVLKGQIIAKIEGKVSSLLKGERTALNFLQRLSGIATKTKKYVEKVKNKKVKLVDTRKTTPCWRVLEKYAVRVGGGFNHRMGLYDGVLIKDNHISIYGNITKAVETIKKRISHLLKIEVETSSIDEVLEALDAKVDVIMLDNMNIDDIKRAVKLVNGRAIIEVSGGVRFDKIEELASANVDLISIGALTHSAVSVDISMIINEL